MNQFNDFKKEESLPTGEALLSVSAPSSNQVDEQDTTVLQLSSDQRSSLSNETVELQLSTKESLGLLNPAEVKMVIQQVLVELLPYIASHGGHVELIDVRDSIVFIKFSGACVQCPLSFYTVTYGIERHIKVKVPWITRVEVVED